MPRYLALAQQLLQQINQGQLRPGQPLPSLRQFAEQQQASKNTAIAVYQWLEQQGWIEARPRQGYFVRARSRLQQPQPAPLSPQLPSLGELGLQIVRTAMQPHWVPLGSAHPCCHFDSLDSWQRQLARSARQHKPAHSHYQVPPGHPGLREQIRLRLHKRGIWLDADDILLTNGCQEAFTLALQTLTQPGDIVAVESPCFYGVLQLLEVLQLQVLEIPARSPDGIDLAALASALKQWPVKALLLHPSYNNPQGYAMPDSHRHALISLTEPYRLPIIEDEVTAELGYQGQMPLALKSLAPERVLLCSSFSKTLDPDLRLGWIAAGPWHDALLHRKFVSSMASPGLQQQALAAWLQGRGYDRHLRQVRQQYGDNWHQLAQALQGLPQGCQLNAPAGGYLCWLQLPPSVDSLQLWQRADQAGISLTPGALFGQQPQLRHSVRLNFAHWHRDIRLRKAMPKLIELIEQCQH